MGISMVLPCRSCHSSALETASVCPANVYWPEHLTESPPEAEIRQNYLNALQKIPFRLNIQEGHVNLFLRPPELTRRIFKVGRILDEGATVSTRIPIEKNQISYLGKSLATFSGLAVDFPVPGMNPFYPSAVVADSAGALWLNYARENPLITGREGVAENRIGLSEYLPLNLFFPEGRLPDTLHLEEVLFRAIEFLRKPRQAPSHFNWEDLRSWGPGTHLTIGLHEVLDFVVPGWIDMGRSSLHLNVVKGNGSEWFIDLPEIDLTFEKFGFQSFQWAGKIDSGPDRTGIHLVIDPEKESISLEMGIRLDGRLSFGQQKSLYIAGEVKVSSSLQWNMANRSLDFGPSALRVNHLSLSFNTSPYHRIQIQGLNFEIGLAKGSIDPNAIAFEVEAFQLNIPQQPSVEAPMRGPAFLKKNNSENITVYWDWKNRDLKVGGVDLELSVQRIHLLSPMVLEKLNPDIRSVGMDGRIIGDFQMKFLGEPRQWKGEGEIKIIGDEEGDLYFQDAGGFRVGDPLVRNTRWIFKKIHSVNWERQYALGEFFLGLVINASALNDRTPQEMSPEKIGEIQSTRGLGPYELNFEMGYDNQPTPAGFKNKIEDYIIMTCRRSDFCRGKIRGNSFQRKKEAQP